MFPIWAILAWDSIAIFGIAGGAGSQDHQGCVLLAASPQSLFRTVRDWPRDACFLLSSSSLKLSSHSSSVYERIPVGSTYMTFFTCPSLSRTEMSLSTCSWSWAITYDAWKRPNPDRQLIGNCRRKQAHGHRARGSAPPAGRRPTRGYSR